MDENMLTVEQEETITTKMEVLIDLLKVVFDTMDVKKVMKSMKGSWNDHSALCVLGMRQVEIEGRTKGVVDRLGQESTGEEICGYASRVVAVVEAVTDELILESGICRHTDGDSRCEWAVVVWNRVNEVLARRKLTS